LRLTLVAIGEKMPDWVESGCQEYRKRLQNAFSLKQIELPLAKRGKNTDIPKAIEAESSALLGAIPAGDRVVALDLRGEHWSTTDLSRKIARWQMEGDNVTFLIGGPDGFSQQCLQKAHERWALSALTLPHPLVRIVYYEQLYRAWSILQNHPYHR
jgi:23S rRNA (pseudouridine1915-N3)-methyltransferase